MQYGYAYPPSLVGANSLIGAGCIYLANQLLALMRAVDARPMRALLLCAAEMSRMGKGCIACASHFQMRLHLIECLAYRSYRQGMRHSVWPIGGEKLQEAGNSPGGQGIGCFPSPRMGTVGCKAGEGLAMCMDCQRLVTPWNRFSKRQTYGQHDASIELPSAITVGMCSCAGRVGHLQFIRRAESAGQHHQTSYGVIALCSTGAGHPAADMQIGT